MDKHLSHHNTIKFGIIIIIAVFGILGGWAVFAKMDLSVQAPGEIIVKNYSKSIKLSKGGKVDKLCVKEGDFVKENQVLLTLDTTQLYSRLNAAKKEYEHLLATKARIQAELANKKTISFPDEINQTIKDSETKIFNNRISNLKEQLDDINYQIKSQQTSIEGLKKSLEKKQKILNSYKEELANWQQLYKQGLVDQLKIYDLQRKINQLEVDILNTSSQIDKMNSTISELKNKYLLIKSNYRKDLFSQLKQIETKLPSIKSNIAVLNDEIKNSKVTSPSDGVVQNMQIHTKGEVIAPYKEIMQIVPKSESLMIEARISPMDIDKVKVGEKAEINFASYVDPSVKTIIGKVVYVSADVIKDPRDPRIQYYKALIKLTPEGLKAIKENNFEIIPGMPVSVFIKAGNRTFISYILYPLQQLLKGAFHAN